MAKILVIGDVMLDHYVFCRALRLSQESPVPIVELEREEYRLGGAANVANNCVALGANVDLVTIIGADEEGDKLRRRAQASNITCHLLIDGKTTIKSRFIAGCSQLLRVDRDSNSSEKTSTILKISTMLADLGTFDAIILSDYNKGIFNEPEIAQFEHAKRLIAAPKPDHFEHRYFRKAEVMILNEFEFITSTNLQNKQSLKDALFAQFALRQHKAIMITRGSKNAFLVTINGLEEIPVKALEIYDAIGAGDTVLAAFTIALLKGKSYFDAAHFACKMATIVAGKLGTRTMAN